MAAPGNARWHTAPELRLVKDVEGTRGIEARCFIAAPAPLVLDLLWRPENFHELFTAIKHFEVLRDAGAEVDIAYRFDAIRRELGYVVRRTLEAEQMRLSWRELSGDLARVRGAWTLEDAGDGSCLAVYRAFVDVGRLIPTRLVAMAAKRGTRQMVERVRDVAQQRARTAGR